MPAITGTYSPSVALSGTFTPSVALSGTFTPSVALSGTAPTLGTYFVDSVNGDDNNEGTTADAPFSTIAAIPAMVEGDVLRLAKSSAWNEFLDLSLVDGIVVRAYGTGNAPLLDAGDAISAGDWSKTGGRTNVYQSTLTLEDAGSTNDPFINIYEDDAFLTEATDIADCDATAGSYYIADHDTSPFTLYVHASGSDDPASNGSTYDYSNRHSGIWLGANCSLDGIAARRNRHGSGSIKTGAGCSISNCAANDGTKHNIYHQDGCTLTAVTCVGNYFGGDNGSLFILNTNTPSGATTRYTNCTATSDDVGSSAFLGHRNVSGDFGPVIYTGCSVTGMNKGFDLIVNSDEITYTDCEVTLCSVGLLVATGATAAITRFTTSGMSGSSVTVAAATAVVDGLYACSLESSGGMVNSTSACTITVKNSEFREAAAPTGLVRGIYLTNAGATLISENNNFANLTNQYMYISDVGTSLTLTGNCYNRDGNYFSHAFVNKNLAEWQSATSQDVDAIIGGCSLPNAPNC